MTEQRKPDPEAVIGDLRAKGYTPEQISEMFAVTLEHVDRIKARGRDKGNACTT